MIWAQRRGQKKFQRRIWYVQSLYKDGAEQFARFAKNVWEISEDGKTKEELAEEGVQALADFIKETGFPTALTEMGIKRNYDFTA